MSKKAILVVSFGSAREGALKAIEQIETRMQEAFPAYDFFRVFTSERIRAKIYERTGETIMGFSECLKWLSDHGYKEVLCQPTYMNSGKEYRQVKEVTEIANADFRKLVLGTPLLENQSNIPALSEIILKAIPEQEEGMSIVFMGHGSRHAGHEGYDELEKAVWEWGRKDVFIGRLEGEGAGVPAEALTSDIHKVYLMFLMITAGRHAQRDLLFGENAWKVQLEKAGYQVEYDVYGLGEIPEIADLFIKELKRTVI